MSLLSKNFTLNEYVKSQTALRKGIDNSIESTEHLEAAEALFADVVQKVRDHFGPTIITSGYRSPALNEAIGGSSNSQHCKGEAVDIEVPGISNVDLALWIEENLLWDQLILEFYTPGVPDSGWVHVSYRDTEDNRMETLTASRVDGKTVYTKGINA